nr:serine hydrolase domain-containing protein [uncultured Mucilaginibacter sp.]
MIKKILALLILPLCLGSAVRAQDINKPKLDSLLDVLAANNKTMGSLAISKDGKVIYQKSVGFVAAGGSHPADAHTKYRIGSISKIFTGIMVFQLIEEKKLTLETTLDKFYPQIPNAAKITIANMLNHHSGLHNFTNDAAYGSYEAIPQTHEQMLDRIKAMPIDFEPGIKDEYSNTNFLLLGYIVEKITGKPYADIVKARITDKIGLKDTYYGGKASAAKNEALSFEHGNDWKQNPETDMSIPAGAGSMVSTPTDLNAFIYALFNGKLLSAASLEKMKAQQDHFGMPLFVMPFNGHTGYGHNGGIDGFLSSLGYFPDEKLAVCYIKNGGSYNINDIGIAALSSYFKVPFTIPSFTAGKGVDLDKFTGTYACPNLPIKITVTKDGNTLMAQATGQSSFPLDATSDPNKFTFERAGVVMEFRPADGQFTLKQGGGEFVFTKEK